MPLLGTPFSLYYQSDRTASFGAAHQIEVPLIGDEIPNDLVDDLPAQNDDLGVPDSIAIAPDGSAIISDDEGGRVLRVAPDESVGADSRPVRQLGRRVRILRVILHEGPGRTQGHTNSTDVVMLELDGFGDG